MKKRYIFFTLIILCIITMFVIFLSSFKKISPTQSTIGSTPVPTNSFQYQPPYVPSPTTESLLPISQLATASSTPIVTPTPTYSPQQIQQMTQAQGQADEAFSQQQITQQQMYPWLSLLPLQNDLYYVYFEVRSQMFVADLYTQNSQTIAQLKIQITNQLQKIVPNLQQYSIKWQIKSS